MRRTLSADSVLPVDGEPIRDGAVAWKDDRIVAVGAADEIGAGEGSRTRRSSPAS